MLPRLAAAVLLWQVLLTGSVDGRDWDSSLQLTRRVTDLTQTLTPSEVTALETKLKSFEDSTSTQVVVVMVSSIGESTIEEAALQVAEVNGIGRKGKDNGVLLFVAKDDRQMRIEVGYGLEGTLPDALAGQIIRKEITPWFRQGDFHAGIDAGITAIMAATRNEYKADEPPSDTPFPFLIVLFILLFMLMMWRRKKFLGGGGTPIFFPGGIPRSGSWHSGGWSGGGGGSGGGFSGGGGSFGGGGASGSW